MPLTGKDHTLEFVLKTTWRDKSTIMELHYSMSMATSAPKPA